jgi:choline dehydrogenase-like flavoprotein
VVLAAAAPESARLLLNSKSPSHPHGIGNAGGIVGKYLTDTVGFGLSATVPYMRGAPPFSSNGYGAHLYIPWWKTDHRDLDFPLGYHVEVGGGGFAVPSLGFGAAAYNQSEGYGLPLKQAIRNAYGMGTSINLSGRGSMVPNEDCYCEIDPDGRKDKWGIPVLRFHWKWSDHELNEARHMRESFTAILETLGGTVNAGARSGGAGRGRGAAAPAGPEAPGGGRQASGAPVAESTPPAAPAPPQDNRPQLGAGGGIIHEVGCLRMGTSPDNGVVNRYCQVHTAPNVFSADGGPFASHGDKNPTHTIIALAWRTAEYLAEEMRKGHV